MATSLTLQNDASLAQGYVKVNGTTSATFTTGGLSTPQATIGSITGILKASSGVVSQAVAGTDYLTSTSGGAITLATAQTPSGVSAVDFTGIPSWAKKITVMFNGVSTSGSSIVQVQIGSGTVIIAGYLSATTTSTTNASSTTGFITTYAMASNYTLLGKLEIVLVSGFSYVVSGAIGLTSSGSSLNVGPCFGGITLSGILDLVRITTVNGADTFDAGTINISYE